jgi:4-carboxymuconolactone decarboxylase
MAKDDEALFDKGLPIRRAVLGAEYVDGSMAKADDFMMSFQRATTAIAWGWEAGIRMFQGRLIESQRPAS